MTLDVCITMKFCKHYITLFIVFVICGWIN